MTKPWDHCAKAHQYGFNTCPLWGVGGFMNVNFCICYSTMMERARLVDKIVRHRHGDKDALEGWTLKGAQQYLRRLRRIG